MYSSLLLVETLAFVSSQQSEDVGCHHLGVFKLVRAVRQASRPGAHGRAWRVATLACLLSDLAGSVQRDFDEPEAVGPCRLHEEQLLALAHL